MRACVFVFVDGFTAAVRYRPLWLIATVAAFQQIISTVLLMYGSISKLVLCGVTEVSDHLTTVSRTVT